MTTKTRTLKVTTKYRVMFHERERGWGGDDWWNYYDTEKEARDAINECNKRNTDEYAKTKRVPDYYIQCDDTIQECEVVAKTGEFVRKI